LATIKNELKTMPGIQTFSMIKPDAIRKNKTGAILQKINESGFMIKAMKYTRLTPEQAKKFYAVHEGKSFFESLVKFITSGPVLAFILEKENAVEAFRELIGSTDPQKAAPGTIRKLFATDVQQNAIHGSDSDQNAILESNFFFSQMERF
jgi:nucleoside-diphosphate kinase